MEMETLELEGIGGIRLLIRDFRPVGTASGTFLVVHGLGEHGGRYMHFGERIAEHGWRVVTVDLRGHGQSAGTRTHVLSFDEYVMDVGLVWQHFQFDPRSTVLFGHSMGGLIAIRSLQMGCVDPAALVVTSPLLALKVKVNPFKWLLGKLLVRFLPKTRFKNGLDPDNMTRDPVFAEERRNDPLIIRSVTASWFFSMQRALALAHDEASKVKVPVLAFRGMADETTDGDVLTAWLNKTSAPSHELISLPLHVHEVFHETDWRVSMARMLQWLEQVGVPPEPRIENSPRIRSCNDTSGERGAP